jgi:OOP family OmpA-OmpF porin
MYEKLMADGRVSAHGIHFDVGSDLIRGESVSALAAISGMLQQHPTLSICIEAHTDSAGAPERNQSLSEARAAAVVRYLVGTGIDPGRLESRGCGSAQPAVPNDTPENRQRNRRIELVLLPPTQTPSEMPAQ